MFTLSLTGRCARIVRLTALAATLAIASVPATLTFGIDTAAQAQQSRGGGGGGSGSGRSGPNPVLKCLGPSCIDVSKAQVPCTHAYCEEKEEIPKTNGCEIRACEVEDGRETCHTEISYDERICTKMSI